MIIRMALCCALIVLSLPIMADTAAAASEGTADQRSACMGDAFRFCMSAIPNHKRIESCLRANRRSISSACYHEIYDDAEVSAQRAVKQNMPSGAHAPE